MNINHSEHKEVLREAFGVFDDAALNHRPDGSRTLMQEIETLFLCRIGSDLHVAAIPRLLGKMSSEATSQVIMIGDRVR